MTTLAFIDGLGWALVTHAAAFLAGWLVMPWLVKNLLKIQGKM